MLFGTYMPKIDDKNRLSLPAKHRQNFVSGVIITKGQNGCLNIFNHEEFSKTIENLKNSDISPAQKNEAIRALSASSFDDTIDKQGRVTIPNILREKVNIHPNETVVVVGTINHLEVWNKTKWDEREERSSEILEDTLEKVMLF